MSNDDLAKHGIRPAARPTSDAPAPDGESRLPVENPLGRFLQRANRVCGFAGLGVGVALLFADLQPAGLAIIFVAVAVLLAEFEDLVCGPPNQGAR